MRDFGVFLHKPNEKIYDYDLIRAGIEQRTDEICGIDKGVNHNPISLTIHSPHVVNLTLVDLPGLTKVPVKGQPQDVMDQIHQMVVKYISMPSTLILALTAANMDIANSDALQLAREIDPNGERTIGVVTKIDLMDEGTDAVDLLRGNIYSLKLGYFGVKNRSQKQINDKVSILEAIQNEKEFFSKHKVYSGFSEKLGITYLTESLNKILVHHIQRTIPSLNK